MIADPRIGTVLAGYRIESLLGRGGMSVVYLAEHLGLKRKAALKLLAHELGQDEAFRLRFVRESQIAAGLDHPNIVPIYEAGEADGLLFIAMRYVRGTDLKSMIRTEGRIAPHRALSLLSQVANALDAAHAEGLVHRDVKPANILVATGSSHETPEHVYLSDFGITKRTSSNSGITSTGQFIGTVDYAAPEQIQGQPIDGRTDQYSLSCVLYECLAGEAPFTKDTDIAVLWAHIAQAPPPISERLPDLPGRLDAVINKAMSKLPTDRYATCEEFVREARASLSEVPGAGQTVVSRRVSSVETALHGTTTARPGAAGRPPDAPVAPPAVVPVPARAGEGASGARRRGPVLVAAVLAVALIGGAVAFVLTRPNAGGQQIGTGASPSPPAARASSSAVRQSPGPSPIPPTTPATGIIFRDSFGDPATGWPTYAPPPGSANYVGGAFEIATTFPKAQWSTTRKIQGLTRLTDVAVQSDVAKRKGADAGSLVAVLCRYQDQNNTYLLGFRPDGAYRILKRKDRNFSVLSSGQASPGVIKPGAGVNIIRGDCQGGSGSPIRLTLWANGKVIGRAQDAAASFQAGAVGIAIYPSDPAGMRARFTNFVLRKLPA